MSSSTSISKTIVTTNTPENLARSSGKSVSAERTLRLVPDGYLAPGFLGLQNTSQWIVAHWTQFIELLLPRRACARLFREKRMWGAEQEPSWRDCHSTATSVPVSAAREVPLCVFSLSIARSVHRITCGTREGAGAAAHGQQTQRQLSLKAFFSINLCVCSFHELEPNMSLGFVQSSV